MAFSIDKWMVAWNPKHSTPALDRLGKAKPDGAVEVGIWPDKTGWSDDYDSTVGCCDTKRSGFSLEGKVAQMFIDFHTLVVGDGIDPKAAHREFLKIDEYRRRISPDIDGADIGSEED
ncbi:hypothetical protein IVB46_44190 [Bradyrhizobium sp. 61]|uniref:hypothetical protein n=1 Tax=Bradyrhizobium sp. 61 TaxID=2782679 RepID=UPI001FFB781B|nr:hypothetical protein [Bradyrhizobium sp. 61]MCK1282238.1 hypothetical protein [Bradyrhizobium sp. 61]